MPSTTLLARKLHRRVASRLTIGAIAGDLLRLHRRDPDWDSCVVEFNIMHGSHVKLLTNDNEPLDGEPVVWCFFVWSCPPLA